MSCPGDSTSRPGDTCLFGHSAPAGESHTAALQALSRWMAWGGERVWHGTETPHPLVTVYPGRRYLAPTAEVREAWEGTRGICRVVSA